MEEIKNLNSHPNFKNRVGERYINKQGYEVEIIEYKGCYNCTIQFNDFENTIMKEVQYSNIKIGTVLNINHISVLNKGFIGGIRGSTNNRLSQTIWGRLFQRCYDEKLKERNPTYKDVTVCKEWYNYQVFNKWFEENYNPETMQGWDLDKDILVKGNKIYSPETCCFVPHEINNLFVKNNKNRGRYPIGVCKKGKKFSSQININGSRIYLGVFFTPEEAFQAYKTAKESYIKEKADEWRCKIHLRVYEVMYKYIVEITD